MTERKFARPKRGTVWLTASCAGCGDEIRAPATVKRGRRRLWLHAGTFRPDCDLEAQAAALDARLDFVARGGDEGYVPPPGFDLDDDDLLPLPSERQE